VFIAHMGKDKSKGVRGHSGFGGNADFIVEIDADKTARKAKVPEGVSVTLDKLRDGEDHFSIYYKIEPGGVPVPIKISEAEFKELRGATKEAEPEGSTDERLVRNVLQQHEAYGRGRGFTDHQLAGLMADNKHGSRPGETGEPGVAEWDTTCAIWKTKLGKARPRVWAQKLLTQRVDPGGSDLVVKWHLPEMAE
jgi:hypothetical protein